MSVADAIEINMNGLAYELAVDGRRLPTIVRDVVPAVRPALVLYSAYGSMQRGAIEQNVRALQAWLATNAPGSEVGIGEIGFPRHAIDGRDMFRTIETAKALQRLALPVSILWEAFDTSDRETLSPFGLLDADGGQRNVMRALGAELQAQQRELEARGAREGVRIEAAVDQGVRQTHDGAWRHYELRVSTSAPVGSATSAEALCDGFATSAEIVGRSAASVALRIARPRDETRYCSLRLLDHIGRRSATFGPVVDCARAALAPAGCGG